jgi:hypothetical protein
LADGVWAVGRHQQPRSAQEHYVSA